MTLASPVTHRYPVICGPTAGGKTALAVGVCLELAARGSPGEVVSMDAFQVYRGMEVGTAKPTADERRGVPHHLIDILDPTESFTMHDWLARARDAMDDVRARGAIPVVAGGTHLYAKALLDGLFEGPPADEGIRAELNAMDPAERRRLLERTDPEAAARIHPNDVRRTVRALEVHRLTGKPISEHQQQWEGEPADSDALLVVIDWETEAINRRINARVKEMMARGLLDETRSLWERNQLGPQARHALGYKQLIVHLEGRATLDEAVEQIKIETRRFAKNQRTWLRRLAARPGTLRVQASGQSPAIAQQIVELITAS